ncbi:MAG: GerMN domain-containing protein [Clostridium sp.]|nr:GerMN domain-containing protein [Clostridium sp.]
MPGWIRGRLLKAAILLIPIIFLFAAGCGGDTAEIPDPENGAFGIYYLNSSGMALESDIFRTGETDPEKLAEELYGRLQEKPASGDRQTAVPEETKLAYMFLENNVLTLNFDKSYYAMTKEREIMCRAALARTLTQIPGVDYISISCDGQPLQNDAGNPVGAFSGSDFVYSIANVNDFEKVTLTLYFADEAGTALVPEKREVVHNMNTSMEKLVVDQLAAGPQGTGQAVIPKETRVLGVSNTDGICYVNLDSSFAAAELTVSDYIPVYAIVDSLTALKTVNRVQITIGGAADVPFHSLSLSEPLDRDETYIKTEETTP